MQFLIGNISNSIIAAVNSVVLEVTYKMYPSVNSYA